jgi:high affinity Mn2+ porin
MRLLRRFFLPLSLLVGGPAAAGEPGVPPSGFYFGGHVGYMFGTANATLGDPIGVQSAGGSSPYGAWFGGVQAGYERFFSSRLMLGLELDMSFPDSADLAQWMSYRATNTGSANEQLEYLATLRGRAGYAVGAFTPFVSGGIAWASTRFSRTDLTTGNEDANPSNVRLGYSVGAGLDYRFDPRWTARAEYLYTNLGLTGFVFSSAPARYDSQYDLHRFRLALSYKFGVEDEKQEKSEPLARGPLTWELHGQTTFIYQGYTPFPALYTGDNSLPPEGQSRETWTASAFLGVRLWKGGEFYLNTETLQGFGVADTTGAAGFPNGEAQKSNFPYPRFNVSRLFVRQEIGLGGEKEEVESEYGQLAGQRDVNRVTLQLGKYSVKDLFDGNAYAEDPRLDFLNWSIWASGAFDYPADRLGFSWGMFAELNRANWAVRGGYFLVPDEPNANTFDMSLFVRGGYVGELEARYAPYRRPGSFRLGTWFNSVFSGSYSQAVGLATANGVSPNDTIQWTRQGRSKYGFYLNLDQEISDTVGLFARYSWNDGRTEIMSFTDIDSSLSVGLSIKGTPWGRPDDRVGIAGAFNNISGDHAGFLAAGGLGVTVGDGALSYASENVFEAYYAFQLRKGIVISADYQFLDNPAYNLVRGPVNVFSGRLHMTF